MDKLQYIAGKTVREPINLDGPVAFVGTADGLRSRAWDYELGYRDVLSAVRPAREVELTLASDYATADALRRVADADVQAKKPGTLVAQGEWRQRCYILSSSPEMIHFGRMETTLNVALLDGAWWRLVRNEFMPGDGTVGGGFLDYSYDYAYDYMRGTVTTSIEPSVLTPSAVRLVFYGPAANPYVVIGGNRYQVLTNIPAGGYVVVDGREKSITLTLADGSTQNAFAYGLRGTGEGGGEYIFEPIGSGVQSVAWNGTFGFELGWYEEEGEPPWSQS